MRLSKVLEKEVFEDIFGEVPSHGYKAFSSEGEDLKSWRLDPLRKVLPQGVWINEKDYRLQESYILSTPPVYGWYVLLNHDSANGSWKDSTMHGETRRVKVKDILKCGIQDYSPVILCREIYIENY